MAKKEENLEIDARAEAWAKHLAKYEKENPVKFASKKSRGEFDKIPASFRG